MNLRVHVRPQFESMQCGSGCVSRYVLTHSWQEVKAQYSHFTGLWFDLLYFSTQIEQSDMFVYDNMLCYDPPTKEENHFFTRIHINVSKGYKCFQGI
jgi:hypothetical protein